MEEQLAFSDWINTNLGEDLHLTHILPLADSGLSLYDAVKDGILLCKIVNHSCSDTVDERVINMKPNSLYKSSFCISQSDLLLLNFPNTDCVQGPLTSCWACSGR